MNQKIEFTLTSPVSTSFRCTKAANSLDIDASKKSIHHFSITADIKSKYNIGLIIGSSGSGKTTLAKHVFGNECFNEILESTKPVIDQFPDEYSYDDCAAMLSGVGLTSVPCWIRPAATLSNGQKARAEIALQMARGNVDAITVIDEWTSMVDRTVAKVMSHCIQKHARKTGKRIVLLSCHYDVVEWLNPDWIIDCNRQEYTDRRLLWRESKRSENLEFTIEETSRSTWPFFSKYHYLSDRLAGGKQLFFGLFDGNNQIGFLAFSNYVPVQNNKKMILHFNRLVIHPDYCGFGIGIKFLNICASEIERLGYVVMGKFSSAPVYNSLVKSKLWKLQKIERKTKIGNSGKTTGSMQRGKGYARSIQSQLEKSSGFRLDVKTYSFKFLPQST